MTRAQPGATRALGSVGGAGGRVSTSGSGGTPPRPKCEVAGNVRGCGERLAPGGALSSPERDYSVLLGVRASVALAAAFAASPVTFSKLCPPLPPGNSRHLPRVLVRWVLVWCTFLSEAQKARSLGEMGNPPEIKVPLPGGPALASFLTFLTIRSRWVNWSSSALLLFDAREREFAKSEQSARFKNLNPEGSTQLTRATLDPAGAKG